MRDEMFFERYDKYPLRFEGVNFRIPWRKLLYFILGALIGAILIGIQAEPPKEILTPSEESRLSSPFCLENKDKSNSQPSPSQSPSKPNSSPQLEELQ